MKVLCVTLRAPVASFRRPLEHTYQRTLPLPPPTTILGVAGAALGLSDRELWAPGSILQHTRVSAWMEVEPSRARDLWTVLKLKGGKIAERSPYFRELLFFTRYTLVYGDEERILAALYDAFQDPAYPLSLGREDELALVEEIAWEEAVETEPVFKGTVIPGNIREMHLRVRLREGVGLRLEPPVVESLPIRFSVDARGIRHPEEVQPFSFLSLDTEVEVPGIRAWKCRGRTFTWLNSSS